MALSIGAQSAHDTQLRRLAAIIVAMAAVFMAVAIATQVLPGLASSTPATLDAPTYVGVVHGADEAAGTVSVGAPTYVGVVHGADEALAPATQAPRLDGTREWARLISEQQLPVASQATRLDPTREWARYISEQGLAGSIAAQRASHPVDVFRGR